MERDERVENMGGEELVVLVTGCSKGGIGFQYCKYFAEKGCTVFASDIGGVERMKELTENHGRVHTLEIDVRCEESVRKGVEKVVKEAGKVDILVNNAGVGTTGPLAELAVEEVVRAWEINCLGPLRMVQAVVPHMAGRKEGTIVNVGSIVGAIPTPWAGAYCSSKAALHSMSEALRLELRPLGIDVVLVMPGAVQSNLGEANLVRVRERKWRLYEPFREAIVERAAASQAANSTPSSDFAAHVVNRLVGRRRLRSRPVAPRRIMYGRMTGLFTVLAWSPLWLRDLFFSKRFGLHN